MQGYQGEDEQLVALKRWWKDNGNSLLIGIGLALAIIFGWKAWEKHSRETAEGASDRYQVLMQSMLMVDPEQEDAFAQVQLQAQELKNEFESTAYARFAALILAKLAVQQGDLEQAEQELRWVLEKKPTEGTERVATSRLARVLAAQERYDDALALMSVSEDDPFFVYFQEIKGDILTQAGRRDEAREAYQAALEQAMEDGRGVPLLEVKLADLATVSE